jgi:LPS sulfotransferase NodH
MSTQSLKKKGRSTTDNQLRAFAEKLLLQKKEKREQIELHRLKKYAVISTPRVGSSLFCQSLEKSGKLGWPVEWFNYRYVNEVTAIKNITHFNLQDYMDDLYFGSSNEDNHIFGVNFHIEHYMKWKKRDFDLLSMNFDKIYYIERRNKFKQAYSLVKALKTDIWSAESEKDAGFQDGVEIDITEKELVAGLKMIVDWTSFYRTHLKKHITREYIFEEFIPDAAANATWEICDDLDVKVDRVPSSRQYMKKQSLSHDEKQLNKLLFDLGANFTT